MDFSLILWQVQGNDLREVHSEELNDPKRVEAWIRGGSVGHDEVEWSVVHPGNGKSALAKFNGSSESEPALSIIFKETRQRAERGNPDAQAALGFMYELGIETRVDGAEAVAWYWKAAYQGNTRAQLNLRQIASFGVTYDRGVRHPADTVKASRKAAEKGNARAQFNLGQMFEWGDGLERDPAEAFKWYRKAAQQGVPAAQFLLGECYCNGVGVQQSVADAVKWWSDAAVQGDPNAQFKLALCYCNGQGVSQDYAEAVKWYREAAEQGDPKAQARLGDAYYIGLGVAADYTEARKWYEEAAEHGDASAQRHLGIIYSLGQGVPRNAVEAFMWYDIAATGNDSNAIHNRKSLAATMTPVQIEAGRRQPREFLANRNGAPPPAVEHHEVPALPAPIEAESPRAPRSIADRRKNEFLGTGLLPIARELPTAGGQCIDLLAIDGQGNLVVLTLKRDKAPHQLLGETLDNASWVNGLSRDEIDALANKFAGKSLDQAFNERFGAALPEKVNNGHSMIMLVPELEDSAQRALEYLARAYDVPIQVFLVSISFTLPQRANSSGNRAPVTAVPDKPRNSAATVKR